MRFVVVIALLFISANADAENLKGTKALTIAALNDTEGIEQCGLNLLGMMKAFKLPVRAYTTLSLAVPPKVGPVLEAQIATTTLKSGQQCAVAIRIDVTQLGEVQLMQNDHSTWESIPLWRFNAIVLAGRDRMESRVENMLEDAGKSFASEWLEENKP